MTSRSDYVPHPHVRAVRTRLRFHGIALAAAGAVGCVLSIGAGTAVAVDLQELRVGNGLPDAVCVSPGGDAVLDTTAVGGDDELVSPPGPARILTGPNGRCETTAHASDEQTLAVGDGSPNSDHVVSGPRGSDNGICDSVVTLLGGSDDQVLVTAGNSTPNQVAIDPGPNDTIDTVPNTERVCTAPLSSVGTVCTTDAECDSSGGAGDGVCPPAIDGDDAVSAVICPGNDGFQSTRIGDDVQPTDDQNCIICVSGGNSCILPGPDGVLDSTADPQDVLVPIIHSGADGISETLASGDDIQLIDAGDGFFAKLSFFVTTVCVDTGANGIADSTLCSNGTTDLVGTGDPEECEDGNLIDGDGCDAQCFLEVCGNGIPQAGAGEECDDGNSDDNDVCIDCEDAECGDTFVCSDGACTSGPGAGPEDCDDGNTSNIDSCLNDCTAAACGDGIVCSDISCTSGPNNGPEQCEDGNLVDDDGCDSNCAPTGCGNGVVTSGEQCDDGNLLDGDGCDSACVTEFCGDGDTDLGLGEQCDDGNVDDNDTCTSTCKNAVCGDGITCSDPACTTGPGGGPEECDDANNKNNDDCITGDACRAAVCGDGLTKTAGTPPFEQCDDGNLVDDDGCSSLCIADEDCCGGVRDGIVNTPCIAGQIGDCCQTNADCDTAPASGDGECGPPTEDCDDANSNNKDDCTNACKLNICGDTELKTSGTPPLEECDDGNTEPFDGCSAICEKECGNEQIDGACSQGLVGQFCQTNADCDSGPPDGVCVTEECDWGIEGLCFQPPDVTCSALCTVQECGNEVLECEEECDLGPADNGAPGSGCTVDCKRNLCKKERKRERECAAAFTVDPPDPKARCNQRCRDGEACDLDGVKNFQCRFEIGVCLNRPTPSPCEGDILSFDLVKVKVDDMLESDTVLELMVEIEETFDPFAIALGRCSSGLKTKICSNNSECDSFLGAEDGICNIPTGVDFDPPLQISGCTVPLSVEVPEKKKLRLRSRTRRAGLKDDRDAMKLKCLPSKQ